MTFSDNYVKSFGLQWNAFRSVQIDSESGCLESEARFFDETGWRPGDLAGKVLLDAGCGAGRFSDVALRHGARIVAVDLSTAAYACAETLRRYPSESYLVLRADLLDLPLQEAVFDGVFSLGVLQHTPDPLGAIQRLSKFLRPGARLATWIYERHWYSAGLPRTWLRHWLSKCSAGTKLAVAKALVAGLFPLGWCLSWLGRTGERAALFLPYASRHHLARGDLARQWRYCVMDTFDWYGPQYDQPQRAADVIAAMEQAGLVNVRRLPARGMAIIGERPAPAIGQGRGP